MPGTHSRTLTATAQIRMRKTRGLSPSFLKSMWRRFIHKPITKARGVKKPSDLLGSDGGESPPDGIPSDPDGSRTRVTAVKGRCPRPLDDGALCCWFPSNDRISTVKGRESVSHRPNLSSQKTQQNKALTIPLTQPPVSTIKKSLLNS
jgi:hypothetical protein